jgi:hypothetical protein
MSGGPPQHHPTLDLDDFAGWCADALGLSEVPGPDTRFRHDLHLDELELFRLVQSLEELSGPAAPLAADVFEQLDDLRDLYLHYLTVGSMPRRPAP